MVADRRQLALDGRELGLVDSCAPGAPRVSPVGEFFTQIVKGWNRVRITDGAARRSAGKCARWRPTAGCPAGSCASLATPVMLFAARHLLLLLENKQKQIPSLRSGQALRSAQDDIVGALFTNLRRRSSLLGLICPGSRVAGVEPASPALGVFELRRRPSEKPQPRRDGGLWNFLRGESLRYPLLARSQSQLHGRELSLVNRASSGQIQRILREPATRSKSLSLVTNAAFLAWASAAAKQSA